VGKRVGSTQICAASYLFFVVAISTLTFLILQLSVGVSRLEQLVEIIAREIALQGDVPRHLFALALN